LNRVDCRDAGERHQSGEQRILDHVLSFVRGNNTTQQSEHLLRRVGKVRIDLGEQRVDPVADELHGRDTCERNKGREERVLDKVLPLFFPNETIE
jgi:hypothetical protein